MNQGRILPLLGPAAVLYLIAEVAASGVSMDAATVATCAIALALSAAPLWSLRGSDQIGVRRVGLLGAACAIALVRWAGPQLPSLYLNIAEAIGLALTGGVTLHLAVDTPDRPLRPPRGATPLIVGTGFAAAVSSALAVSPPFELFGATVLVPPRWESAPLGFALVSLFGAALLRALRRRLGSSPEALAAGTWAQLGTCGALLAVGGAIALDRFAEPTLGAAPMRALAAGSAASLLAGHLAMLGTRRHVHAGRNTRRVLAGALALGSVAAVAAHSADRVPREPIALGLTIALCAVLTAVAARACSALLDRVLAPFGGRLLRAADEALAAATLATDLEELGRAILPPLRRASGALDAQPLLIALSPSRHVRIDAAGIAHVEARETSEPLLAQLREKPGEIVVAAPLAQAVVRTPARRPLVEALERHDALCVVPLTIDLEVEGLIVVPRGRRRAALTLEEIDRLERLGRHVAAKVALLSAHERSRLRTRDAVLAHEALLERHEAADEELARLRRDLRMLQANGAAELVATAPIAYSAPMRALLRRLDEIGPLDAPVLLLADHGIPLEPIATLLHASSGRRDGPFVVADCASVRPERSEAALFGEAASDRPGWLRLAEGGTCVLLDVPALSSHAQAKLAEAIATRRASTADESATHPIDVRVVATSRVALGALAQVGAFDLELWRRLEPLALTVPSLRERVEDIPSLVLLALDRACRALGRPVIGIEPNALAALAAHEWPGNVEELAARIDRAVAIAKGAKVALADLALPVSAPEPADDPLDGTYHQIERRMLLHALARAGGNKSEAARLLALKRTTFIDKLRRHRLSDAGGPPASEHGREASR